MVTIEGGRLLVFGGRSFQGTSSIYLADTWVYTTVDDSWELLAQDGPLPRSQHAMAYDSERDQVLVFGGYVGSSFTYGDTWLLDVGTGIWRRVQPSVSPSARAGSVLVYDEGADAFVMFAGAEEPPAAELPLAETWLFDPAAEEWAIVTTGVVPTLVSEGHSTLFELAMVYDRAAERSILLVAGESTWGFDAVAGEWQRLDATTTQGLGADYMTAAAYDSGSARTVAYGGAPVDRPEGTWSYDSASDTWVEGPMISSPGPMANHAMAYDPVTAAVYLFGGAESVLVLDGAEPVSNTMWVLDGGEWRRTG